MNDSCKKCGHAVDAHFHLKTGGMECRECAGDITSGPIPICPVPLPKAKPKRRGGGGLTRASGRR